MTYNVSSGTLSLYTTTASTLPFHLGASDDHRTLPLSPPKVAQKRKMAVFRVKLHFA